MVSSSQAALFMHKMEIEAMRNLNLVNIAVTANSITCHGFMSNATGEWIGKFCSVQKCSVPWNPFVLCTVCIQHTVEEQPVSFTDTTYIGFKLILFSCRSLHISIYVCRNNIFQLPRVVMNRSDSIIDLCVFVCNFYDYSYSFWTCTELHLVQIL